MTTASTDLWNALDQHEVPAWFHDAKLGIFLHWGLYSVPAWAPRAPNINDVIAKSGARGMYRLNPYSEWYRNSYRVAGSPSAEHHRQTYGDRDYYDFHTEFDAAAGTADMAGLARSLREAGAEYVVLTSKHHDGFTLWPSAVEHPRGLSLQAQRDVVGDLTDAVREHGMRMGLYYSGGYDWSVHDIVMKDNADVGLAFPATSEYEQYASAHVRELVERYQPSVLWNDIGWPGGGNLARLFTDYYQVVPEGVINDRWAEGPARRRPIDTIIARITGALIQLAWPILPRSIKRVAFTPPRHCDFTTPEYQTFDEIQPQKWEQTRGIGHSFALNRNETSADMIAVDDLIHGFVDVVSKNGNLLLGVGPAADGSIPQDQQRVLDALGAWLAVNRPAIMGTRPWHTAEGRTDRGTPVRFTQSPDALNAILLDSEPPSGDHLFPEITEEPRTVELLGVGPLPFTMTGGALNVTLPADLPDSPAHALQVRTT